MKRVVIIGLLAAVSPCGPSVEQKQQMEAARQLAHAAQGTEQVAQQAAKGSSRWRRGSEALAGGSGDTGPVDPVSFRDFMPLVPDLDGWEKAKLTGERMSSPVSFSTAEVRYTTGDASITLEMRDSGFNQLLLMPSRP